MTMIDDEMMQALMADMSHVARTEVLPRFAAISSETARAKSAPDDLVTDADLAAETVLGAALQQRFPGITLIGEEAVSDDPGILARLADAELAAVIDPIDGTWNFAHGIPVFGMILAIVVKGQTIAGLIHYPVTGGFIVARPGLGAWHIGAQGEQTRLSVTASAPVDQTTGFISLHLMPAELQARIAPRLPRFRNVMNWRCSAFEYRLLATGAMGFILTSSLNPWDHAAGLLIHHEAGGYSALLDGTPYNPCLSEGNLLLAPDEATWEACRQVFSTD